MKATHEQIAHNIGYNNLPHSEPERALFRAWLKGHGWGEGIWDPQKNEYRDAVTGLAYAVWRARGALAEQLGNLAPRPPARVPITCTACRGPITNGGAGVFWRVTSEPFKVTPTITHPYGIFADSMDDPLIFDLCEQCALTAPVIIADATYPLDSPPITHTTDKP